MVFKVRPPRNLLSACRWWGRSPRPCNAGPSVLGGASCCKWRP
jgi:hypothetical protein